VHDAVQTIISTDEVVVFAVYVQEGVDEITMVYLRPYHGLYIKWMKKIM
jgi:hypothetical protein